MQMHIVQKQNLIKRSFHLLTKISFVFLFIFLLGQNTFANEIYTDNFDTDYSLGSIDSQNGWTTSAVTDRSFISDTDYDTAPYSFKNTMLGSDTAENIFTATSTLNTILSFDLKDTNETDASDGFNDPIYNIAMVYKTNSGEDIFYMYFCDSSENTRSIKLTKDPIGTNACTSGYGTILTNVWTHIDLLVNWSSKTIQVSIDGGDYSSTQAIDGTTTLYATKLRITSNFTGGSGFYMDNFGGGYKYSGYIETTPMATTTATTLPVTIKTVYYVGEDISSTITTNAKWTLTNKDTGARLNLSGGILDFSSTGVKESSYAVNDLPDGFYTINADFGFSLLPLKAFVGQTGYFFVGTTTLTTNQIDSIVNNSNKTIEYNDNDFRPCGITDISGCFYNAFVFLFNPSRGITERFQELNLENRAPFIYAYEIDTLRQEMFNASDTGTTEIAVTIPFGTITFLSKSMIDSVPYASTIKNIIGFLLYIMMAELIYLRVKNLHN